MAVQPHATARDADGFRTRGHPDYQRIPPFHASRGTIGSKIFADAPSFLQWVNQADRRVRIISVLPLHPENVSSARELLENRLVVIFEGTDGGIA